MRTIFSTLARICAALCATAFVISLVATLVLVNAESRLFHSETYKHALQTTDLYEQLPGLVAQQMIANGSTAEPESGPPGYLKYLTATDWEILIETLVTPRQTRQIAEQALDQVFDYLNGKSDSATISLLPIKENMARRGTEVVKQILDAQPACTLEQLAVLTVQFIDPGEQDEIIWCRPPLDTLVELDLLINELLRPQLAARVPDSVTLLDQQSGAELLPRLQSARQIIRLSLLAPLAFLLLMTLLAVRSRLGWLRWWGLPMAVAGALGLLAGFMIEPLTRLALTTQTHRLPAYVAHFVVAGLEVFLAIAREVANPVMLQSALLLAAGAAMLILAKNIAKEKPKTGI